MELNEYMVAITAALSDGLQRDDLESSTERLPDYASFNKWNFVGRDGKRRAVVYINLVEGNEPAADVMSVSGPFDENNIIDSAELWGPHPDLLPRLLDWCADPEAPYPEEELWEELVPWDEDE